MQERVGSLGGEVFFEEVLIVEPSLFVELVELILAHLRQLVFEPQPFAPVGRLWDQIAGRGPIGRARRRRRSGARGFVQAEVAPVVVIGWAIRRGLLFLLGGGRGPGGERA